MSNNKAFRAKTTNRFQSKNHENWKINTMVLTCERKIVTIFGRSQTSHISGSIIHKIWWINGKEEQPPPPVETLPRYVDIYILLPVNLQVLSKIYFFRWLRYAFCVQANFCKHVVVFKCSTFSIIKPILIR